MSPKTEFILDAVKDCPVETSNKPLPSIVKPDPTLIPPMALAVAIGKEPAAIPVRLEPSPLKAVAVTVPSTVTPVADVANLAVGLFPAS